MLPELDRRVAVAITVDLHDFDMPEDISVASSWLRDAGIPSTFFIPSAMFRDRRFALALRELPTAGHEVSSHTHNHDAAEIDALMSGRRRDLQFLAESRQRHAEFFAQAPLSFRSPGWCALSPTALDTLQELGYSVDSSATPQRWSVLSSTPFRGGWTFAPRRPHFIRPGLLELPTSTAIVPGGSPTFQIFRRRLSLAFLRLLMSEAKALPNRILVLQFHPEDFNPGSAQVRPCPPRLRMNDFLLKRQGGFGFKHFLKDANWRRVAATTREIIEQLAPHDCRSLADHAAGLRAAAANRRAIGSSARLERQAVEPPC
jgi:peptidoglycan/xylan/chitin deacetylase (PgdA/CDA1 family)